MSQISIDFSNRTGAIKPVHGVGQPPTLGWNDYSMFHYLKEAGIPFSRLHDTGGAFGKGIYVDIPNLFHDFDANPYDPASYDFAFTDLLMQALVENNVEPYFRLGVTIENSCKIKAYRIFPPKDNLQWARICEGIIRHYTEGWADGFKMHISHWEIWNEPENQIDPLDNCMWRGTFEQYMELYNTASKYLKKLFPHLKIGGYASCGLYAVTPETDYYQNCKLRFDYLKKCFVDFVNYVKLNKCPLDFFSFHYYDNVMKGLPQVAFVRKTLDEAGLTSTEMSLNEWLPRDGETGSMCQAANIASMILAMQDSPVDDAELYDARCGMGRYSPLFEPANRGLRKAYYVMLAFNELYKRKNEVEVTGVPDGVWAVAANGESDAAFMLSNISGKELPLDISFGGKSVVSCKLIDEEHAYDEVALPASIKNNAVILVTLK